MTPQDRAALLHGLAHVETYFQGNCAKGGEEGFRLVRAAGATWPDLFPGPSFDPAGSDLERVTAGYRMPMTPEPYGRAIRTLIAFATPWELVIGAVAVNKPQPDHDDFEVLRLAARQLLARRAQVARSAAET